MFRKAFLQGKQQNKAIFIHFKAYTIMFLINSSGNFEPNSSLTVTRPSVNFFTIFGTLGYFLCARIQKPLGRLRQTDIQTDTETRTERAARSIYSIDKGPQSTYKVLKRAAGHCSLPNKPRVSTREAETIAQTSTKTACRIVPN